MSEIRLFLLEPTIIFEAQINLGSATYPLDSLPYDGVVTGAFGDIELGQTVLIGTAQGGDDLGRTRVRKAPTSNTLYVGRSSLGIHDGEVTATDDAYITVLNDFRVWSKIPFIEVGDTAPYKTTFKDSDILVGTYTNGDEPPVANAGPPAAGTINSVTSKLQVMLPHYTPNRSFAVADGATISTYLWVLPSGVTLASGATSDAQITIDCDPGFYWISLTVTDSNGSTHTTRTFVIARDPAGADDGWETDFNITRHRVGQSGQTLSARFFNVIPETTYPDGTLCMVIEGEPGSLSERDNILFWGWHQNDPSRINVKRTATIHDTTLDFVDVAGRLDTLPGFSQVLYNDAHRLTAANPSISWEYMVDPTWDKLMHYLLLWHSTALELTDWLDSGTGDTFDFVVREAGGGSLYDQVNRQANSLVPERVFTCDRLGRMAILPDPILQEVTDRTATVQAAVGVEAWRDISYTYMRPPRIHWLDDNAMQAGVASLVPMFSHSPGDSPGQGEQFQSHGEQIAVSQEALQQVTGQRYARLNSWNSKFQIRLTEMSNNTIDPAAMSWVTLTLTPAVAAERGLNFTTERGLVHEMTFNYSHDRRGVVRDVSLLWERETSGPPGTYVPPPEVPDIVDHDPYTPPPDESSDFYDPVKAYIVWDRDHIGRTLNLLATPPVWELVDTGVSGNILDCQYVGRPNGNETIGLWCLTSAGVFWCADIMATTPSWSNTLTLATMQAAETAPDVGTSEFRNLANHGFRPGYAIVATEPTSKDTNNINWPHGYFHFTDDYGATWTVKDSATELTRTTAGGTSGYMYTGFYGSEWFRASGGRIYCVRATPRRTLSVETIIMYSDDDGDTWVKGAILPTQNNDWGKASLLNPHPNPTSTLGVINGNISSEIVYTSVDNGAILTARTLPTGMRGFPKRRLNSRHEDAATYEHHLLGWAEQSGSPYNATLVKSDDGGVTWANLHATSNSSLYYNTPNGWPPDVNIWFTIALNSAGQPKVQMSTDYFATGLGTDKTGNLTDAGVFNGWNNSVSTNTTGGIALPKIGANA